MGHMGSVNTQSVREEAERIKTEFQRITSDKKIDPELSMLMQSMLMLINLLIAIFLERTTKKNNKNSSKPSSQTEKDESSITQKETNSKGKKESDSVASNTRTIETVTVAKVAQCDVCGEDLTDVPCQHFERRTKIDIVFEKVVEHVDAEIKRCNRCDSTVKGKFPSDMPGPLQYGAGLKAYIINLLVCQMISLNRAQKLVKTLIGSIIAESSLLQFVLRLHLALEQWESDAIEQILKSPAMNVDETSLRVDKKNHWIHVYSAGEITLKFLHRNRGSEAINNINIIPRYSGTIIHDCWASYLSYNNCDHGLCGSHIVRELTCIIESNGYKWAVNMKALLLETCKKVSKRKKKKLSDKQYANLQKRYRNIITRGKSELPAIPKKPNGKRGTIAKSDAHNLWERLRVNESSVLLFAKKSEVPFTNNRAERDLRMSKVKQKVSGCFRKELYAKAYCRISSYLQTMANKGYNPLIAIQMALAGKFN
ncbi:IS66 family transposase [Candidatus Dependentiae bacterium]|nr:IS66 family transposase [Candidatus Dependentiae bacterium]